MTVSPPTRIGRYEIEGELGRGMMGVVYRALDPALGRAVALKTVSLAFSVADPAEREVFEKRFLVEARSAAGLSHPGIIVVHDVGRDPGTGVLYIALEYLEGRTLSELTSNGQALPWREALRITASVAEALHHAHSRGIVHRDIKPANIMVLKSGQPKVMDFGIAKVESGGLTAAGQFFGTPRYMAPEQALGQPVDARADLFALGAVLYSLLTGRAAFDAKEVAMILMQVMRNDPPPPSTVVPVLPPEVDYVVARSLAKSPVDRYPTGQAFAQDLEDILAGRPPRYRASWSAPVTGTGTVVSTFEAVRSGATPGTAARDTSARVATAAPEPAPGASAPRPGLPRGPVARSPAIGVRPPASLPVPSPRGARAGDRGPARAAVWALALLVALASGVFVFLRLRTETPTGVPAAPPSRNEAGTPAPREPRPPPLEAAAAPPASEPAPTRTAPVSTEGPHQPAAAGTPAPAAGTPARLLIDFEHPLKSGTMRLWLDDTLLIEANLQGHVTREVAGIKLEVAGIKLRKGGFEKEVELAPGRHRVRVQVVWEDNQKSDTLLGTFRPGQSRRLEIRIGLLRKNLSAEWK